MTRFQLTPTILINAELIRDSLLMRPRIDDILNVLQEIRSVDHAGRSGRSVKDVRLQAVQKVAKAELAKGRFKNWDSAEKSIHDA